MRTRALSSLMNCILVVKSQILPNLNFLALYLLVPDIQKGHQLKVIFFKKICRDIKKAPNVTARSFLKIYFL
jgi:hypothetical protein